MRDECPCPIRQFYALIAGWVSAVLTRSAAEPTMARCEAIGCLGLFSVRRENADP